MDENDLKNELDSTRVVNYTCTNCTVVYFITRHRTTANTLALKLCSKATKFVQIERVTQDRTLAKL